MEVTKKNFNSVLSQLPEIFEKAQFIAIDTEFTGLKVEGANKLNYFDTLEDLYCNDRLKVETFLAIQIGLVAFIYDDKTNRYSHAAYNFYVYPSSYSDINFTCQSKSIQFLSDHEFDFNKVFKYGIPYLKDNEVEKLVELADKKRERNNYDSARKVPDMYKKTVDDIIAKIQGIKDKGQKSSFTTEPNISFVRALIYDAIETKYGSSVYAETNKNETMTISVGLSAEELKEKLLMKKQRILDEQGFSKVIKLMVESKKLIVGHNIFLDLLFIIKQFLSPLPDSYDELKEMIRFLFPSIIDTKHVAAVELKNLTDSSLKSVTEYYKDKFLDVPPHSNCSGYKISDEKFHEASYDAYLTGQCFLKLAGSVTSNVFKDLPKSVLLESYLNKLSVPRLHDIWFMNLGGKDKAPDRSDVYHLTFPKEWVKADITSRFDNYGLLYISWINSTSAYIRVKKSYIDTIEKSLKKPNQNYKLLSFDEFKSSKNSLNHSSENAVNNETKVSNNNDCSPDSNEFVKKRPVEDIGEVIERPAKKLSS